MLVNWWHFEGMPNFSWCGRAGSVVPFFTIMLARGTARRYMLRRECILLQSNFPRN